MKQTCVWNINLRMLVARKGAKTVPGRTSNSRETVTFLPCINAAGQKMPPLIIVKGKTSRSLRSYNVHEGPDGALWTYQKKAYMTDEIWRAMVLRNLFEKLWGYQTTNFDHG